jgi:phosphatidylglycerol:prolipoprotein diacylglycerol transferase
VSLLTLLFLGLGWDPITIDWDPTITDAGPFELTWHGVFTAVGIAAGVYLGAWLARREGFTEDDAYSIALVGVPVGIVGARAMWVVENWETIDPWTDVFRINEGGITVYGAVAGGVIGAVAYGAIRRLSITRGLDAAGFGLLLGMAIGRIGDLINGEHWAKESGLPWAVVYTNEKSPGFSDAPGLTVAVHPATTYEMIGDLLIIGIMALVFTRIWRTRPGVTFFIGLVLYSAMRFGVSYLRLDSCSSAVPHVDDIYGALEQCPEYVVQNWMTFPQVVAMSTFFIGVAGLAWTWLRGPQPEPKPAPDTIPAQGRAASPRRA